MTVTRRVFLRTLASGAAAASTALPGCGDDDAPMPVPDAGPPDGGVDVRRAAGLRLLHRGRARALAALADAILPPDDAPGGADLGAVEYIERLLGALDASPPRIYAGGPFSGRAPYPDPTTGTPSSDDPAERLRDVPAALDRVTRSAWRLELFGSAGRAGGAPNDALLGPGRRARATRCSEALCAGRSPRRAPFETLDADAQERVWHALPPLETSRRDPRSRHRGVLRRAGVRRQPGLEGWRSRTSKATASRSATPSSTRPRSTYLERPDAPLRERQPGPRSRAARTRRRCACRAGHDRARREGATVSANVLGNTSLTTFDVLDHRQRRRRRRRRVRARGERPERCSCSRRARATSTGSTTSSMSGVVPRFSNDELKLDPPQLHRAAADRSSRARGAQTEADGDRTFVGDVNALPKTVGGAAVHADLKMPRFAPDRLPARHAARRRAGRELRRLAGRLRRARAVLRVGRAHVGVQGRPEREPVRAPARGPYPMPPGLPMYGAAPRRRGRERAGYTPFPYPTAVNSRPYDGRPACVDCGFCSGYGCPSNAKGSPAVTTLREALVTGNCQLRAETRAVRLVMSATGTEVIGVEAIGPDGARQTFTADRYVLAASPIEDARLLFLSDPGGAGVGNSSGLVGRNLMFHFQTIALGIFDERLHGYRGRAVSRRLRRFPRRAERSDAPARRHRRDQRRRRPARGGALLRDQDGSAARRRAAQGDDAPEPGSAIASSRLRCRPRTRRSRPTASISIPTSATSIGLPVARLTYKNHAFELARARVLRAEAARHSRAGGRALRRRRPGRHDPGDRAHHGHAALRDRSGDERVRPRRALPRRRQPVRRRRRALPDLVRLQPDADDRRARRARRGRRSSRRARRSARCRERLAPDVRGGGERY